LGKPSTVRLIESRPRPLSYPLPRLRRRRPRAYEEWAALRRWGKLPSDERIVAGYLLRAAREAAGLSQAELAGRLGCSQQAVSQAERWGSNPTVDLLAEWADATGARLELSLD
jgi:ribosome-binding protein aMBF1 (putative translation factor)